jgi:hypothetical protein
MKMSLMPTEEDEAYSRGCVRGEKQGYVRAVNELLSWLKSDEGMIPVGSIRKKLEEMKRGKS